MSKFKVGDRVAVIDNNNTGTVECALGNHEDIIGVKFDNGRELFIHESDLTFITGKEKIIIYRSENKVIARKTDTRETAEAKCNPSDDFDFNVGAKLAFNRLLGIKEVKEEPKQLLNCKFVVIDDDYEALNVKAGKVYEVKDGRFMGDRGQPLPLTEKLYSFDDLVKYFENKFSYFPVKIMKIIEEYDW